MAPNLLLLMATLTLVAAARATVVPQNTKQSTDVDPTPMTGGEQLLQANDHVKEETEYRILVDSILQEHVQRTSTAASSRSLAQSNVGSPSTLKRSPVKKSPVRSPSKKSPLKPSPKAARPSPRKIPARYSPRFSPAIKKSPTVIQRKSPSLIQARDPPPRIMPMATTLPPSPPSSSPPSPSLPSPPPLFPSPPPPPLPPPPSPLTPSTPVENPVQAGNAAAVIARATVGAADAVQPSPTATRVLSPPPRPALPPLDVIFNPQSAPRSPPPQASVPLPANPPQASKLWGWLGELWNPAGRLTDFSYSGYHHGQDPLPSPPVSVDLKADFGAVGDGSADDTEALRAALDSTPSGGVLFIPAGMYRITKPLVCSRSIIVRGAGRDQTFLYFPNSMKDVYPDQYAKDPSAFSSGPYFITFSGYQPIRPWTLLANITQNTNRGDRLLSLSTTRNIKVGDWVRVAASDINGTLPRYLTGGGIPGQDISGNINVTNLLSFVSQVKAVYPASSQVELARPLPYALNTSWLGLSLHQYLSNVTEVGIESLTFRFPPSNYPGHALEHGYSGLSLSGLRHSWVRNVRFVNADNAMIVYNSNFCTAEDILVDMDYDRSAWNPSVTRGIWGHHGISVAWGSDNLVRNFTINTYLTHDLTFDAWASHSVYKDGRGVDLSLDLHKRAPNNNIFTNLDCGRCSRVFASGGGSDKGANAGIFSTYWNIFSSTNPSVTWGLPSSSYGAQLNFVGLSLRGNASANPYDWLQETVAAGFRLVPEDIHQAQLKRRQLTQVYP